MLSLLAEIMAISMLVLLWSEPSPKKIVLTTLAIILAAEFRTSEISRAFAGVLSLCMFSLGAMTATLVR